MKKKKTNYFLIVLFLLFIFFLSMNLTNLTDYFEYKEERKVMLTNKSIEKFEDDIKNNRIIDVNNYVFEDDKDYSGIGNNIGEKVSYSISIFFTKKIGEFANFIKKII